MSSSSLARTAAVALVLAIVGTARSAGGEETPTLEARAAAIDEAATRPDGDRVVVGHISRRLGIPVETLRTQRAQTGCGWADVLIGNHLAALSRLTFEQIIAEWRSGRVWTEVASGHGVDPAALLGYVRESQAAIEQRSDDKGASSVTADGPSSRSGGRQGHNRPFAR